MVTMTWGRSPPAAGREPVARATLQAPTRPSRRFCGRERRSRHAAPGSFSGVPAAPEAPSQAAARPRAAPSSSPGAAGVPVWVVRGLVAVFMTVRRCSNCSAVAKISRCWSPWRGLRMKAPWSWRRSSSEGSAPSWSSASVQLRATRARRSGSFSAAVRVRACSIPAAASGSQVCRTRSRARVMMVAARDETSPAATAAPSSSRAGGKGSPENPCRGRRSPARASRRRASAALIRSRARRNSVVFRYPSSTARRESAAPAAPSDPDAAGTADRGIRSGCHGPACSPGCWPESSRQPVAHAVSPSAAAAPDASAGPGGAVGGVVPPTGGPRRVRFRGGGGLFPGPVHGTGRHELQVVQGPREFLHRAGEIRRLPEVPQGGVPGRRRRHLPDQRQGRVHALNTGHTGGPRRSDAPARVLNGDEIPHGFHETHTSGELRQNNAGQHRAQIWANIIRRRPIRSAGARSSAAPQRRCRRAGPLPKRPRPAKLGADPGREKH